MSHRYYFSGGALFILSLNLTSLTGETSQVLVLRQRQAQGQFTWLAGYKQAAKSCGKLRCVASTFTSYIYTHVYLLLLLPRTKLTNTQVATRVNFHKLPQ